MGTVVGDAEGAAEPPPAGLEKAVAALFADFGENPRLGSQAEETQRIPAQCGEHRQVGGGGPPWRLAAQPGQEHLELEVGRRAGAPVRLRDGSEHFAGFDAASRNQALEACGVEMTVGGPEDLSMERVADSGRNATPGIAGIVTGPFHLSGERRPHRCTCGSEDLDPQLEGGGRGLRLAGTVSPHSFGDPWFEVPADRDACRPGGRLDGRPEGFGGGPGIDRRALRRQVRTDRDLARGYRRGGARGGALDGGPPFRQPGQGGEAGGHPEPGSGDVDRFGVEGPEEAPHAHLAHHQILIGRGAGNPGPPQGRDAGAHERPDREGDAEEVRFSLAERPLTRESGEHPRGCRKRIECGGGGVEGRRRRFTDQRTPDGVPKIQ